MTRSSVRIQITPESKPSTPSWMREVAAFAQVLSQKGTPKAIQEQVRFARARFGRYEVIDFVAVLIGYILSGEPTRLSFYERLAPFAELFMALFGRDQLPHRSTLSRFLASLDHASIEALRTLFLGDLLARIGHCRGCPLRAQCQESPESRKPRRVSAVLWPLSASLSPSSPTHLDAPPPSSLAPVLWKDWPRCRIRRGWRKVVCSETVCLESSTQPSSVTSLASERFNSRPAPALASFLGAAVSAQRPSI